MYLRIVSLVFSTALTCIAAPSPDLVGADLLRSANQVIGQYHGSAGSVRAAIKVVYFTPADRAPLPDYSNRLDRIMTDVTEFYRQGLERFGISNDGPLFERKGGKLVIHLVHGKYIASKYDYNSGPDVLREVTSALAPEIDVSREFIVVISNLVDKTFLGKYVFHSPYYGYGSDYLQGVCFAADCELLDPLLLRDTTRHITYSEHNYPRMRQTVAQFNSWYLGGLAHELGHALGLRHNRGCPGEDSYGISLMGTGNFAYRQEIWHGGMPAILTRASALQLLSHPTVAGSRQDQLPESCSVKALTVTGVGGNLVVNGSVFGNVPAYSAVAFLNSTDQTDYDASTYIAIADRDGFSIIIPGPPRGTYRLLVAVPFCNGYTAQQSFTVSGELSNSGTSNRGPSSREQP